MFFTELFLRARCRILIYVCVIFAGAFNVSYVLATESAPAIYFRGSVPVDNTHQTFETTNPQEIVNIINSYYMEYWNECLGKLRPNFGTCTYYQVTSLEAQHPGNYSWTYNGVPSGFVGHTTYHTQSIHSDGSIYVSPTELDVNGIGITTVADCRPGTSRGTNSNMTCVINEPSPNQCTAAGNPINYLTGDKFQPETDFMGAGGLQVNRTYLNQRQGWKIESVSKLFDKTGRFTQSTLLQNDNNCLGYSAIYKLRKPNFDTPDPDDYLDVPTEFCLQYLKQNDNVSSVILRTADGLHHDFYNKGTYYAADFYSAQLVAIDPVTNNGLAWALNYTDGKKEFFDKNGLLIKVRNGADEIIYSYQNDQIISKTNKLGDALTFTYDAQGRVTSILTPTGKSILYTYVYAAATTLSLLDTVTVADGSKSTYKYENPKFPTALTGIVDNNNVRYATWTYDDQGRATSSQHAGGNDLFTFDYTNLLAQSPSVTVTNPLLKKTTYNFSVINGKRLITKVDGVASANCGAANKINEYYPTGLLKSKTDWNGNKTTYLYNAAGQETSRTEGSGSTVAKTITTEWDAALNLKTKVTEPNKETTYSYDANGLLATQSVRSLP